MSARRRLHEPGVPGRSRDEAKATKGNQATMSIQSGAEDGPLDEAPARDVAAARRRLINVAYRMLGSLADAEDVVQETYARWYGLTADEQAAILVPDAWLTTVASRLCLNLLTSARVRRESYVGEWIPEPVPEFSGIDHGSSRDVGIDPADRVTLDESIDMAFLVMLEAMTPAERVSFILHDVFRYSFAEVADVVGRTPAACRQLASSARRRLRGAVTPSAPSASQAVIVRDFKLAWESGDIEGLIDLLAPDAVVTSDGGGRVNTVLHPIEGADRIAGAVVRLEQTLRDLTLEEHTVNGRPGLIARRNGVTVSVYAFQVTEERITHIWAVRNPEKLRPWISADSPA